MKKILLVLTSTRRGPESIRLALAAAQSQGAELVVAFILDDHVPTAVIERITEEGWIGGRPSQQLGEAIAKEFALQATAKLKDVEQLAQQSGVATRTLLLHDDWVTQIVDLAQQEGIGQILFSRTRRSNVLTNFVGRFFGSSLEELKKKAPCPVVVISEH